MKRFEVGKTYKIGLGIYGTRYITITARNRTHIRFTGDYTGVRAVYDSKSRYTGEAAYIDLNEIHPKAIAFAAYEVKERSPLP